MLNNDNINTRRYSGLIAIVLCFMVMLSTMITPAFASGRSRFVITEKGATLAHTGNTLSSAVELYYDTDTPLTLRFFLENKDFALKFSDGTNRSYCIRMIKNDGTDYKYELTVNGGDKSYLILNYDKVSKVIKNYDLDLDATLLFCNYEQYGTITWTPEYSGGPKPMNTIIKSIKLLTTSLLSISTMTMAFVWNEPLPLAVFVITLLFVGIVVCKRLSKGV